MGAIFANVGIVLTVLGVIGTVAAVVWAYVFLFGFVGLAALFESKKTSDKSVDADHDRNMKRQARAGRKFSLAHFKFIDRPSLVDERTTHQGHH